MTKIDWKYVLENIETNCANAARVLKGRRQSEAGDDVYRVALALEMVGEAVRPLVDRVEKLEAEAFIEARVRNLFVELARRIQDLLPTNRGVSIVPEAIEAMLKEAAVDGGSKAAEPLKLEIRVVAVGGSDEPVDLSDSPDSGGHNGAHRCVTYSIQSGEYARRRAQLSLRFLIGEDPHWKIGQKIKFTIEEI